MILQSADGVYAVREGPWKWIEGVSARQVGAQHPRKDQHHPRLINLSKDPGETSNVTEKHPDVAKRLSTLLNDQRDRGASRTADAFVGRTKSIDPKKPSKNSGLK